MKDKTNFFNYNPKNNHWIYEMYLDYLEESEDEDEFQKGNIDIRK